MAIYTYKGYQTVDNFWDRYPLEFQDIYDRFALSSVAAVEYLQAHFGLTGRKVLDIGAGTGKSTFLTAKYADYVVGIEPFVAMRTYAREKQKLLEITNVIFIDGIGEDLSQFGDKEFDCVISVHSFPIVWGEIEKSKHSVAELIKGCLRVTKAGGYIALVSTTPGWQWDHLVGGMNSFPDPTIKGPNEELLEPYGLNIRDCKIVMDFGTIEEALATYGFIYGEKAIDYILDNQVSKFSWSLRIFHKRLD